MEKRTIIYRRYAVATRKIEVVSEVQVEKALRPVWARNILPCQRKKVRNGGSADLGDSYCQLALSYTIKKLKKKTLGCLLPEIG